MKAAPSQMRMVYSSLYALVFALLLLAAFNPRFALAPQAVDLMLLLDESASIDADYNQQLWKRFTDLGRSLPAGSRVSLLRFADQPVLEIPWMDIDSEQFEQLAKQSAPRHRAINASSSHIADALTTALRYLSAQRQSAVIISSDGFETDAFAQPPRLPIEHSRLSIFYLPTSASARRTVSIESINLHRIGEKLELSVALKTDEKISAALEIHANNQLLQQREVSFPQAGLRVFQLTALPVPDNSANLDLRVRGAEQQILARQLQEIPMSYTSKLLFISRRPDAAEKMRSVLPKKWVMTTLTPSQIPPQQNFLQPFDVIVLDDISAPELTPQFTVSLQRHIRQNAAGLVVVGGAHAFSAGAYRHSQLEKLLPVLSEPAQPRSAAAFAFVLDKSGSMEAKSGQTSRLDDALSAVIESAKSLLPGDQSALLAFDRDITTLLPLQARADPASAFDQRWPIRANGSTRLVNALNRSAELLAQSSLKKRFLVIVTDGIFDDNKLAATELFLRQHQIQLIALVIGENNDLKNLRQLTNTSGGRLIRVDDSARLSFYMRNQLDELRPGWQQKTTTPQSILPLPGSDKKIRKWRQLAAYTLTRARDDAQVYVISEDGDPLLASANVGAGRVIALPGGWLETSREQSILPLVIEQVNSHGRNPRVSIHSRYRKGQLTITVDALTDSNQWRSDTIDIRQIDGSNAGKRKTMELIAAGRYQAQFDLPAVSGSKPYRFLLHIDGRPLLYQTLPDSQQENKIHTVAKWLEHDIAQQKIKALGVQSLRDTNLQALLHSADKSVDFRQLWLVLALVIYLLLILYERPAALARFNPLRTWRKRHE